MAKQVWKLARWLVGMGLLIIGARNVPEPSSKLEQPWRDMIPWPWLQANWVALACFVLAAVLLLYSPLQWWIERKIAKDVRLRVRANLTPGTFHETDGAKALRYLLRESVWGWRAYTRLNFWTFVDGLHLAEFERAAREGEILTTGAGQQSRATVVIDTRAWINGRIMPGTATQPFGVTMREHTFGGAEFERIGVATPDLYSVWPRASLARRCWSLGWVGFKKRWYWLLGVPNMLRHWWRNRPKR